MAMSTLPAVPIREIARFGTGLSVRVSKTAFSVSAASGQRGDLAGRAEVSFTLVLRNDAHRAIDVSTVQVAASYGSARTPAVPSDARGTTIFHGSLAAGTSASAHYSFLIPKAQQSDVDLTVSYRPGVPTVLFHGSVR